MKILNFGNLAIVLTLIATAILGQFYSDCLSITFVLGLFVMPAYQLLVGFIWFISSDGNKEIRNYFIGVVIYFIILFSLSAISDLIHKLKILEYVVSAFFGGTPVLLALFFTYNLNQYSKK
jgi:heme/copper-type cytochrome/quinol oxidase subunit 4